MLLSSFNLLFFKKIGFYAKNMVVTMILQHAGEHKYKRQEASVLGVSQWWVQGSSHAEVRINTGKDSGSKLVLVKKESYPMD